jgi:hypothetical protein
MQKADRSVVFNYSIDVQSPMHASVRGAWSFAAKTQHDGNAIYIIWRKEILLAANLPVAQLLESDQLPLMVFVPEMQIGKLGIGQTAQIPVDTYTSKLSPDGRRWVGWSTGQTIRVDSPRIRSAVQWSQVL